VAGLRRRAWGVPGWHRACGCRPESWGSRGAEGRKQTACPCSTCVHSPGAPGLQWLSGALPDAVSRMRVRAAEEARGALEALGGGALGVGCRGLGAARQGFWALLRVAA